jgi:hypothetical protein
VGAVLNLATLDLLRVDGTFSSKEDISVSLFLWINCVVLFDRNLQSYLPLSRDVLPNSKQIHQTSSIRT